jgi:hypothetical protein
MLKIITVHDFKRYCRARVTKAPWCWYKNKPVNQWKRREDPEINSQGYSCEG